MGWFSRIRWNSIHGQLLTTYLLLAALGSSLMAGYILWSFHAYFIQSRERDLENWTTALSESAAEALEEQDSQRLKTLVQRYGASDNITLRVLNPQGQLLASSNFQRDQQIRDWRQVAGVQEALQNRLAQGAAKGAFTPDDRLYIARPIVRRGQLLGVLRMSITLEQFQRQFTQIFWTLLAALALTILLCAVISDRFARGLSQPIETMQKFAIALGNGHFGDRLSIRQTNELGELAVELNRMSERLASLDQERRAFLANVSHELRTPISNVQLTVAALKSGAIEEPELRERFFQTLEMETKRSGRLIQDLLELGRLEAGAVRLEQKIVSLKDLLDRAVIAMEPRAQTHGLSLQVRVVDLQILGDPERLLQAVLNVLDNAIKHSSPNAQILLSGQRHPDGQQAQISIQDHGPGIDQRDLPRIFEQFYTADPSRRGSSTGLGLAITKRIVEAHGGSIVVNSSPGQGATFVISVPLLSPQH